MLITVEKTSKKALAAAFVAGGLLVGAAQKLCLDTKLDAANARVANLEAQLLNAKKGQFLNNFLLSQCEQYALEQARQTGSNQYVPTQPAAPQSLYASTVEPDSLATGRAE